MKYLVVSKIYNRFVRTLGTIQIMLFVLGLISTASATEITGAAIDANTGIDSSTFLCSFSKQQLHSIIDDMGAGDSTTYGIVAWDSTTAFANQMHRMIDSGTFLTTAPIVPFDPENIPYNTWLINTLSGANTSADSIEHICKWIAENFPAGEYDARIETLPADSIYLEVINGRMFGLCGVYSIFLQKVAAQFPSWGIAAVFSSIPDSTYAATENPSHTWVEFIRNNEVYCIADPTLGGVIRGNNNTVVTGNQLLAWLYDARAESLHVNPIGTSLLTDGPCVFTHLLLNTDDLVYYEINAEVGFTRAHWRSFDDPLRFNRDVPYWKAKGFYRMTYMNVYEDAFSVSLPHLSPQYVPMVNQVISAISQTTGKSINVYFP